MVQPRFKGDAGAGSSRRGQARTAHRLSFAPGRSSSPLSLPLLWNRWIPFTSLPSVPGICVRAAGHPWGSGWMCAPGHPRGGGRGVTDSKSWGSARRARLLRRRASWVRFISTVVSRERPPELSRGGNKRLRALPAVSSQKALDLLSEAQASCSTLLLSWIHRAASTWPLPPQQ